MAPSNGIFCVCVCINNTAATSIHQMVSWTRTKILKKTKKQKWWLHRATGNRYETKLPQTWPNNKAETLCRGRLGWSGLFIGSLWGLLTETHICLTHTAIIKELAVSPKTDKEVNILLHYYQQNLLIIAFLKKKKNHFAIMGRGKIGLSSWLLLW